VSSIFDRNKRIVVRTKGLEQFIGKPVSSEFVTLLERGGREGTATTRTLEGVSVFTAYVRSPLTGWGIGLGIPAESVYSPLQLSLVAVVGGGLVVIALALALAAVVGRRITGPITTLARGARAFGQGASMDAGVPVGVNEIDDVRRAFQEAGTLVRQRALEAEKANRTKDEFLAVLSHELRTPLNAVYGWARMLQAGQVDEATTARALDVIVRQSNAQVQLIDDLLDVSRMSVGKMRLDVRQVDLPAVIEHALDAVRPAAAAKSIRLQPVLDPRGGPVVGDPDRLQQVVWNLLMNAVKFTPRNGRVQLYLQRVTSHVEIVVSDDGPGIPPEVLPFIFEPFRQGDSSSTRAHSGLGLGLALVRHLVDLHGGSVTAQSDGAGGGATFVVRLPLPLAELGVSGSIGRAHPKAGSEPPHRGEIIRLDGVRVVVADDDPEALELASTILGGAGGEVRTCSSAAEALEAFRQSVPDVLISDIEMPGEDGYSLIRRVRALPAEQGGRVPAVALTAYGRTQDRVQSLAAGFTMHVPKPVDPGELTTIVASVCRISAG
jgi:signal transduction histidine kinase/ActR/RegA family two-component response regulator